jgi:hypothetical protein
LPPADPSRRSEPRQNPVEAPEQLPVAQEKALVAAPPGQSKHLRGAESENQRSAEEALAKLRQASRHEPRKTAAGSGAPDTASSTLGTFTLPAPVAPPIAAPARRPGPVR